MQDLIAYMHQDRCSYIEPQSENMAAPHESNVVHVLSVQTTTAGVSTVTGSIYALDFRHMFMIHRRYHKLTDFSHTRNSNHLRPDGPSHVCSARSL